MTDLPCPPAMTHLRTLRRAVWWPVSADDITSATSALNGPVGDLYDRYRAVDALVRRQRWTPTPAGDRQLGVALGQLDVAAHALLGPSGWEPPRG